MILGTTSDYNFICTFPSGNGYIDVVLTWKDDRSTKAQRFKLNPETSTKASLTIAFENET
jgi:hypothetical protein